MWKTIQKWTNKVWTQLQSIWKEKKVWNDKVTKGKVYGWLVYGV
jgi:hypothetical protein